MKVLIVGGENPLENSMAAALSKEGHQPFLFREEGLSGNALSRAFLRIFEDRGIEAVLHLNSEGHVHHFQDLMLLLEAMKKSDVTRLVYSSVAGSLTQPRPSDAGLRAQMMAEMLIEDCVQNGDLGAAILRSCETISAHPGSRLIPRLLSAALSPGGEVAVGGTDHPTPDGSMIRDFLHEDDFISAHILALPQLRLGELIEGEIGWGRGISVRELVQVCQEVTGREIRIAEGPKAKGIPTSLVADSRTLREKLGWKPLQEDIRQIVSQAWDSLQKRETGSPAETPLPGDRRKLLRFFEKTSPPSFVSPLA